MSFDLLFRYLGILLEEHGQFETENRKRVDGAKGAFQKLCQFLRNRRISLKKGVMTVTYYQFPSMAVNGEQSPPQRKRDFNQKKCRSA